MELLEGIETRRSCRTFKAAPVPRGTLEKVMEAAARSPSYTNTQPWEVAVVCGDKKDQLAGILCQMAESDVPPDADFPAPKKWPPDMEARAKEHAARRYLALGIQREDKQRRKELNLLNYKFYGAPCVLFLFMDRTLTSWSIFDMGLFVQNLVLAAHSFGLGTCLQASIGRYPDAVRDFLGIPKTKSLVLGISVGYPDFEAPLNQYKSSRVRPSDFVRWYV